MGTGGVADHVHLLVGLPATRSVAELVRELKKSSTSWIHRSGHCAAFAWQEGYAAFSASASRSRAVAEYIRNQEQHHRVRGFREELVRFLERSGVDYDARYLD